MNPRSLRWSSLFLCVAVTVQAVPVRVEPVTEPHGMVVAAHPEAARIGADVLAAGGNAIDAAVAVSLALGVAEPYGSGLGGKLMLLYHDAANGETYAVDGMDAAGSRVEPDVFRALPERQRSYGWTSVCVPGLAAALHEAHVRWGSKPWAENVAPAIALARKGSLVLPKTHDLFQDRLGSLRAADEATQRLFLPGGEPPAEGSRLANEELARTMELLARDGASGFYRGRVAEEIVAAARAGGGYLTLEDFARYRARVSAPLAVDFRGYRVISGPPPTSGGSLHLTLLKALEQEEFSGELRSAENIDLIGRFWREVLPLVQKHIGDAGNGREAFAEFTSAASLASIRGKAHAARSAPAVAVNLSETESVHASTTHFVVVDRHGNVVSATQSQSFHFGACVSAAGVVMNNSMSNFSINGATGPNYVAPGRRPRSTISPTIVLREGKPVLALGIPGASRIPTAMLQVLLDRLVFGRPLEDAIGDTRLHWHNPLGRDQPDAIESEASLPDETAAALQERGWVVSLREPPGTGRHFGGVTAITINPDGSRTGYADPRRTNAAVGH